MTISSKENTRKYFLPVYVVWAIVIPVVLIFLNGYTKAYPESSFAAISEQINWKNVPAMFALYGLIYPLTIVTFPGFYISFRNVLGFKDTSPWDFLSDPNADVAGRAKRSVTAMIILTLLWMGPIAHLLLAFIYHKKYIQKVNDDKPLKWSDYLFGFI